MHASIVLTSLAASLAIASPISRRDSPDGIYHGVSVAVVTSAPGQPEVQEPAPVEINVLTSLNNASAYKLELQPGVHPNVDITRVQCRAFQDEAGQVPGSAPFNYKSPAYLATNPVQVGSILCYIATIGEAEQF